MGLFEERGQTRVPVWFMRQAGRYHSHYQGIKKNSDFMTMCKDPKLAVEITMGPINDFNFDAAILFSDLLFPLEQLGMGLNYRQGPPRLEFLLETKDDLKKLRPVQDANLFYQFQGQATEGLRKELPQDKTLLGFVGAPFTLYTYAVEGGHSGNLVSSKKGLHDGRFEGFYELLEQNLLTEMSIQAENGADAICLFDTAAGELCLEDYSEFIIPKIRKVTEAFKKAHPTKKIVYYSKFTHVDYLRALECDHIDVLGVDWRHQIQNVLAEFSNDYYIQGNFDPAWLHLPTDIMETKLRKLFNKVDEKYWDKWIMGLGHGVLVQTPEENVRRAVQLVHEHFKV